MFCVNKCLFQLFHNYIKVCVPFRVQKCVLVYSRLCRRHHSLIPEQFSVSQKEALHLQLLSISLSPQLQTPTNVLDVFLDSFVLAISYGWIHTIYGFFPSFDSVKTKRIRQIGIGMWESQGLTFGHSCLSNPRRLATSGLINAVLMVKEKGASGTTDHFPKQTLKVTEIFRMQ